MSKNGDIAKALPSELSAIRELCKLPQDKSERAAVLDFLKENRHYISLIAASAAEIKRRCSPIQVCVTVDVIMGRPVLGVAAESEDIEVQDVLDAFFEEWYDPVSIDLGCIRFEAMDNWASARAQGVKLRKAAEAQLSELLEICDLSSAVDLDTSAP